MVGSSLIYVKQLNSTWFLLWQTFVDVDAILRERRTGMNYASNFLQGSNHQACERFNELREQGIVPLWLFLLCFVTKSAALLSTRGYNQSLIKFFNTETTCIYMLFQTI